MHTITLEQFEGPLDLLLKLIEEQKLDITEVSLSRVTDQYLAYLHALEERPTDELADFLVVAAKLLLIKSKALLPVFQADDDEIDLESQLKIYKEFLDASKAIHEIILRKRHPYPRPVNKQYEEPIFNPPSNLKLDDMKAFMLAVIERLEPIVHVPEEVIERTVSIQEKIRAIETLINSSGELRFRNLVNSAASKTEIIVTFLALLELIKQNTITVRQDIIFEDISIKRYSEYGVEESA
ncbi:MAG: ScpA family protein [bacterium]|nr:ScpA family protein [bacterium]